MSMIREFMIQTGATLPEIVMSLIHDNRPAKEKFMQSLEQYLDKEGYQEFIIE